jgi:hypothetical protein
MRLTRRGRLTVTLTVVTVLLLATTYALTRTRAGTVLGIAPDPPPCSITAGGETRKWSQESAMTATTVAGVGARIGATLNGVAAALDRTVNADEAITPAAARATYRLLPDQARPAAASLALARALLGYHGPALVCAVPALDLGNRTGITLPREDPGGTGLTPRADRVRATMREVFGKQTLGGFAPEGVRSGHIDGSAHYEGRAIDVFFRPVTVESNRDGWLLGQWLVAHAQELELATVIFDRRIWSWRFSVAGWRDYQHPDGPTDNPILLHQDHVHLDVREGV